MIKKLFLPIISVIIIIAGYFYFSPRSTAAQESNSTATEEAKGKEILQKLQDKQVTCQTLTNDDYELLGEYFMGQMTGSSHASMNQMMTNMMGEEREKQMHITMGKRFSGCDWGSAYAPWSFGGTKGGGNPMMGYGGWNNMMGWGGFGVFGWLSMIIFWILLILGVTALIRYLFRCGQSKDDKTPLDILKERYARGEIEKKEFEEKKKDLR